MTSAPSARNAIKRSPLRIFTIFALGIIIPGGFLAFLGFRSFQYESLLLRKQMEDRFASLANSLKSRSTEMLDELLDPLRRLSQTEPFQHGDTVAMSLQLERLEKVSDLPLAQAVIVNEQGKLWVP